jgi:DNA-directed RNA polymerase specialized sigma24 family protein
LDQSIGDAIVYRARMTLDDLFVAAQTGNREAREALADAVYVTLRTFFRRRCRLTEAEDLVQKTVVLIYQGIDDFVPDHSRAFEANVITTAHRVLITMRRSWARERIRRVDSPPLVLANETSVSERLARRPRGSSPRSSNSTRPTSERSAVGPWRRTGASRRRAKGWRGRHCAPASIERSRGCETLSFRKRMPCGPIQNRLRLDGRKRASNI